MAQSLEQTQAGLRLKAPKTRQNRRNITLPSTTVEALRQHKVRQMEEWMMTGLGRDRDGLLFTRHDSEPVNPRAFSKEFKRMAARADLPTVTFHGLRQTHISQLLRDGVHDKVVSERAGHASRSITLDIYAHVVPNM